MLLFSALPKEWMSYYLHWQMFSSCLNSWKFNRLASVEVYTVREGHGNAVPRRNRIAGLVSYNWKPECLSLWGLYTDETTNLGHAGKKKVGYFCWDSWKYKLLIYEDWIISEKVSVAKLFSLYLSDFRKAIFLRIREQSCVLCLFRWHYNPKWLGALAGGSSQRAEHEP